MDPSEDFDSPKLNYERRNVAQNPRSSGQKLKRFKPFLTTVEILAKEELHTQVVMLITCKEES